MTDNTAALDALAETALAAYYRDARVPVEEQNEDDAAWLLAGTYDDAAERVDAHENDTGCDCPNWRAAVMDYYLIRDGAPDGMTPADYADALCTLFDVMDGKSDAVRAACIARATEERDRWHAIAERPDGSPQDAETAAYLAGTVEDLQDAFA